MYIIVSSTAGDVSPSIFSRIRVVVPCRNKNKKNIEKIQLPWASEVMGCHLGEMHIHDLQLGPNFEICFHFLRMVLLTYESAVGFFLVKYHYMSLLYLFLLLSLTSSRRPERIEYK